MANSWKPAVRIVGEEEWVYNDLRFATEIEAFDVAFDMMTRWCDKVTEWAAHESDDAPTERWDGEHVSLIRAASG